MQNQASTLDSRMQFSGSFDALSKIYRHFGMKAVYKGFGVTMMRDVVSFAIFFGSYEALKEKGACRNQINTLSSLMIMGGIAGALLWTLAYPIDVLKTKIQLDSFVNPEYENSSDAVYQTLRKEGIKGFSKGFGP